MGKHAQLVIGPAGSGKSSYCHAIHEHCLTQKRKVHMVNLDPAAEHFKYPVSIDIRDLISLDDVSQELKLGPNGGLIFCMEYLIQNIDWLEDQIGQYNDDYLIIDCPGQIELYSHIPVMKKLVSIFDKWGYRMCCVYLLDCTFISDISKYVSGILACLSGMIQLELPHINLLTKIDLLDNTDVKDDNNDDNDLDDMHENMKLKLDDFLDPDLNLISSKIKMECEINNVSDKYKLLTYAIIDLLKSYNMVSFLPMTIKNENNISNVLSHIDHAIQYGEDKEPNDPDKWINDDVIQYQYDKMNQLISDNKSTHD